MATPSQDSSFLSRFEQHLIGSGFTRRIVAHHLDCTETFLSYLQEAGVAAEAVTPEHLSRYLRAQLQRYRRKHGRSPISLTSWRHLQSSGIHKFLVFVQGRWPPAPAATNDHERSICSLLNEFEQALHERRALATSTIVGQVEEARRFLHWLPGESAAALSKLEIRDVDRYIKTRAAGIARSTCRSLSNKIRSLLRFLHTTGRIPRDLAAGVIAPTRYRFEGIPSTIEPEQIRTILASVRKDRSPRGLRNYAILLLLATYGLRAGEARRLQLQDIDWRGERLWIQHSKTGARSCLPLLPFVGQALLDYIRRARPPCKDREVFIRLNAPRCAFLTNSTLYCVLRRQLAQVGIRLNGKRGPHIFRHARAASLLRSGVSLKTIGDVLGHRSTSSTAEYLKLADQELRAVALAIPLPEVAS